MDVFIDFKSPAAYLAVKPTLALAARHNEPIHWHPVNTKQGFIPNQRSDEDRGATHRRIRAIARQRMHLHYANALDVPMRFRPTPGETDLALVALETMEGDRTAFLEAAFRAYWTTDADLADAETVARILREADSDAELTDPKSVLTRMAERAMDNGAIDAPAYIVRNELFIGREHLPWIESLISYGG